MRISVCLCLLTAVATVVQAAEVRTLDFSLRNERETACEEVVRVSLPVPAGLVPGEPPHLICSGAGQFPAQARVITRHPDGSARRVILSIPIRLEARSSRDFSWNPGAEAGVAPGPVVAQADDRTATVRTDVLTLQVRADGLQILGKDGTTLGVIAPFGPALAEAQTPVLSVIENGPFFAWLRWRQDGTDYSREWDLEVDKQGRVKLTHRILRHLPNNGWTPDFGFEFSAVGVEPVRLPERPVSYLALPIAEPLHRHPELVAAVKLADRTPLSLVNPLALRQHRGSLEASRTGATTTLRFSRVEPVFKETDGLLLQEGMWRVLTVVLQPEAPEELAATVDMPVVARVGWQPFDAVYRTGPPLEVKSPVLKDLAEKYISTIAALPLNGDDWGSLGGLERYNHCQAIWEDYFRSGDPRLRRVALDYSENYHNFSIYWGLKSYIVQYATNALPYLRAHRPDDKRLRDTILACNDWMAKVQTAGGGWSYPGPTTAGFQWNIEYCHGLILGHEVEPKPAYLDAVQRELRAITALFQEHHAIPGRVTPWEYLAGKTAADLRQMYRLGVDRDRSRDFTEGRVEFGVGPDHAVCFQVLLRDYLRCRSEDTLFARDEHLDRILHMSTSQEVPR